MNALDFVFAPHNYLPSSFPLPFTIPATSSSSSLVAVVSDVAKVTATATVTPTEALLTPTEPPSTYNTSTPLGFLLYVVAQTQKIFASGAEGGIFLGGPTRSYWVLTIFMVHISKYLF